MKHTFQKGTEFTNETNQCEADQTKCQSYLKPIFQSKQETLLRKCKPAHECHVQVSSWRRFYTRLTHSLPFLSSPILPPRSSSSRVLGGPQVTQQKPQVTVGFISYFLKRRKEIQHFAASHTRRSERIWTVLLSVTASPPYS